MVDTIKILDMLDWHMPIETQLTGISLAQDAKTIVPFIQPLTQIHNKNVWENCAIIITKKNDAELQPHLVALLEWLQDMNWPGAFRILERLQNFSDKNYISSAINTCIEKAKATNDKIWESNLSLLLEVKGA